MATNRIDEATSRLETTPIDSAAGPYALLDLVQDSIFKLRVELAGGVYSRDGLACAIEKKADGEGRWTYTLVTTANLAAWDVDQMLSVTVDEVDEYLITSVDNRISGNASLVGFDPFRNIAILTMTIDQDLPVFSLASELPEHMAAISFPTISGTKSNLGFGNISDAAYYVAGEYTAGLDLSEGPASQQRGLPVFNEQDEIIGLFATDKGDGDFIIRNDGINAAIDWIQSGNNSLGDWGVTVSPLGLTARQFFLPEGMKQSGLWVSTVYPDSPACLAGVRSGDIILDVDGNPEIANATTFDEVMEMYSFMLSSQVGSKHALAVYRPENSTILNPAPILEVSALILGKTEIFDTSMGFEVCDLNPLLRRQWVLSPDMKGILVSESSLWQSLPAKVVITQLNGQPVENVQTFRDAFERISSGDEFTLEYITITPNYEKCYQCGGLGAHQKAVLTK